MKWPEDQIKLWETAFLQVLATKNITAAELREGREFDPPMRLVHTIARHIQFDINSPPDSPAYQSDPDTGEDGRVRLCDYQPTFELYPKGCNDTHRNTMLRYVAMGIGLID